MIIRVIAVKTVRFLGKDVLNVRVFSEKSNKFIEFGVGQQLWRSPPPRIFLQGSARDWQHIQGVTFSERDAKALPLLLFRGNSNIAYSFGSLHKFANLLSSSTDTSR